MFEENKENFLKGNFFDIIRRGFILSGKFFIPSYIVKIIAMVITLVLSILTMKLIEFLTNIDINPTLLMILLLTIILTYAYSTFLINISSDGMLYHSSIISLTGKKAGVSSIRYSFKNISKWLIIAALILIIEVFISIIFSLISNIGEPFLTVSLWIYRIGRIMILPIFYLVIPIIIIERTNPVQEIQRSVNLGFKNYLKVFVINISIFGIFFIVRLLFSLFNKNISLELEYWTFNRTLELSGLFDSVKNGSIKDVLDYIITFAYFSIMSSLIVISVGIRTVLTTSLMGEEKSPEETYEKVKSIAEKL